MSYDFSCTRTVKSRKRNICDQCRRPIEVGEAHSYSAGKFDGDFMTCREHNDCREVWLKLWKLRDLGYGDVQDLLHCDEEIHEERSWIAKEYPAVAARLWPEAA